MTFLSEDAEQERNQAIRATYNAMTAIMQDETTAVEQKIAAARIIAGISTDLTSTQIAILGITEAVSVAKKNSKDTQHLTDQIKRLRDEEE